MGERIYFRKLFLIMASFQDLDEIRKIQISIFRINFRFFSLLFKDYISRKPQINVEGDFEKGKRSAVFFIEDADSFLNKCRELGVYIAIIRSPVDISEVYTFTMTEDFSI